VEGEVWQLRCEGKEVEGVKYYRSQVKGGNE
jgi:hypothetical protein